MASPVGTDLAGGPVVDISGELLAASTDLRDAGAVSLRGGVLMKVNVAGDAWEPIVTTFTRYATEADLPATVDAGVIAWSPA